MNVGTPIVYVDKQGNEWAGQIVGRTWQHHQPVDEKTGQPVGPVVRNELGTVNIKVCMWDGHDHFFEDVSLDDLAMADLDANSLPVFETLAARKVHGGGTVAPPSMEDMIARAVAAALAARPAQQMNAPMAPAAPVVEIAPPPVSAAPVSAPAGDNDYQAFLAWCASQGK